MLPRPQAETQPAGSIDGMAVDCLGLRVRDQTSRADGVAMATGWPGPPGAAAHTVTQPRKGMLSLPGQHGPHAVVIVPEKERVKGKISLLFPWAGLQR